MPNQSRASNPTPIRPREPEKRATGPMAGTRAGLDVLLTDAAVGPAARGGCWSRPPR